MIYEIRCSGRAVDPRTLEPIGPSCDRTYPARPWHIVDRDLETAARAAGWRIGVDPSGQRTYTCPTCSRPDPVTAAICRELQP